MAEISSEKDQSLSMHNGSVPEAEETSYPINREVATILESITDAFFAVDREWRFTYVNAHAEVFTGTRRADILGKSIWDIFPGMVGTPTYQFFLNSMHEQKPMQLEVYYPEIQKWLEIRSYPSRTGLSVYYNDITERKEAQEKLRQSEERFRALLEQSTDAVEILDQEGTILYASNSVQRVLGYTSEEIVNTSIFTYIHPDDTAYLTNVFETLLTKPERHVEAEYRVRHKDGSWAWVEATGTNLLHEPSVQGIVGNFRNITERKRAEAERQHLMEQLERERTLLEQVFTYMPGGVVIAEAPTGKIIMGNRQVETILGHPVYLSPDIAGYIEWKGYRLDGTEVKPDEWPLARAVSKGEVVMGEVVEYVRTDGRHCFIRLNAAPIRDKQGNIVAGVVTFYDVTENVELEKRKDEFISMASHELKTPVTSLKGFTQLLHRRFKRTGDEQSLEFLQRMDAQINKLTHLISDLLDISKIETGKLAFREEVFDLGQLVQETVENVQRTTLTHTIQLSETVQARVFGDKDRIEQVLINLLTNAIKYSPEADTVVVRMHRARQEVIVGIQDFGIGIAEEHQQRVFERFYQVTEPMEKTFPGLGIGLYISSQIILRHGGRMWVKSKKGEGSTFCFALPL